jgi:hypothetical protein
LALFQSRGPPGARLFLPPLNADYRRWMTAVWQRAKIFGLSVVIGSYLH